MMPNSRNVEPIDILLVEDNPGDVRLTQEALKDSKVKNTLHIVTDGVEAMDFIYHRGNFHAAPRPDIILLDLNLPRMDGREVLQAIKQEESLRRIPIVIMTTSDDEHDILHAYDLYANCYITKPVDFQRFIEIVKTIENFWFSMVRLPPD
jgi:two-component system, chemotaxis family, response regulator Rcp1